MTDHIDIASRKVPPLGGFSWTFFSLELKRLFRNYSVIIFTVVFPIAMLFLLALPQKNTATDGTTLQPGGVSQALVVMISMAVYAALVGSTMTGVNVAYERGQGWSRQLRLTPLNPAVYIGIKVGTGMVLSALAIVVTIVAAALMGITAPLDRTLWAGFLAWLTSLTMTSLGLAIGYAFPSQNAMRYMGPLLPVLAFMAGLFVPLSALPNVLAEWAKASPLWGISNLAQTAIAGEGPDPLAVPNLVVWFVIFTAMAIAFFRRDTKRV